MELIRLVDRFAIATSTAAVAVVHCSMLLLRSFRCAVYLQLGSVLSHIMMFNMTFIWHFLRCPAARVCVCSCAFVSAQVVFVVELLLPSSFQCFLWIYWTVVLCIFAITTLFFTYYYIIFCHQSAIEIAMEIETAYTRIHAYAPGVIWSASLAGTHSQHN